MRACEGHGRVQEGTRGSKRAGERACSDRCLRSSRRFSCLVWAYFSLTARGGASSVEELSPEWYGESRSAGSREAI